MDSTVLGVLAGAGLRVRRLKPRGSLTLCRLNESNLKSIKSLGLHRIANVDPGEDGIDDSNLSGMVESERLDELENARMCLKAHEDLVETDEANQAKFQNVITLMQKRVDKA